jgi:hypothetical protein
LNAVNERLEQSAAVERLEQLEPTAIFSDVLNVLNGASAVERFERLQ